MNRFSDNYRIPRVSVASSSIHAIGYCAETRELDVEFTNGVAWRYYDVKPTQHAEFLNAHSIGKHYIRTIKGSFRGVPLDRVTGEPKTPQPGPDGQPERVQDREP